MNIYELEGNPVTLAVSPAQHNTALEDTSSLKYLQRPMRIKRSKVHKENIGMECTIDSLSDAVNKACQADADILAEYYKLTLKDELTDEDAERLAAIYTKAEASPLLNFLINELDYIVNQKLGLLNVSSVETYKDQQAWLREHLEQMPLDRECRKEMQQLLSEEGFYEGPIDGILGKRSTEAIDRYSKKVQELLHEWGLYEKDVDGLLGEHSIQAVKQFQRANALKEDGVPGRQTFTALADKHHGI